LAYSWEEITLLVNNINIVSRERESEFVFYNNFHDEAHAQMT